VSRAARAAGQLEAFLAASVLSGRMPGAVWRVEGPGGTLAFGAVGLAARLPREEPAHPGVPYDLASLTKPLATALLAVLLEAEGRLDLEEPAVRWLPELGGSPLAGASLLDLGAHRAGLPAWRPMYLEHGSLPGYLRGIAGEPQGAPAGETLYSDLGYLLLGAAIERSAGKPLDALFAERVARPLASTRFGFARGGRGFRDAAPTEEGNRYEAGMVGEAGRTHPWRTGLLRGEVHDANAWGLEGVAGNAGLFGTAEAVTAVAREILWPRVLPLDPRSRRRLLERAGGEGSRTFGLVLARDSGAARGVLSEAAPGHTGFTGTSLWLEPDRGRVYVLLTNRVHPRVPLDDFQPVRLEFHRLAAAL
jgi:serine-type D-Ala-D-Ala carboxypeptidase